MILSGLRVVGRVLGSIAPSAFDYWISELYDSNLVNQTYAGSAVADNDGNVYSTGTHFSSSTNRLYIIKQDVSGNILWQNTYLSNTGSFGDLIKIDSTGNIYILGRISAGGQTSGLLVKYDINGNLIWHTTLAAASTSYVFVDFDFDGDGNIYIAGGYAPGESIASIWKYSPAGTRLWQRNINGASTYERFSGITLDAAGNIYATGRTNSQGPANDNVLFVKYDSSGTLQLQRVYGTATTDQGIDILVDNLGNIYILSSTSISGSVAQVALMKVDSTGAVIWQKHVGGTATENPLMMVFGTGGIYVLGTTASESAGSTDNSIIKFDLDGNIIWQNRFGTTFGDGSGTISVGPDNTMYIAFQYTNVRSRSILAKLPGDGSLTGTYGPFVYATTTLPINNTSYTTTVSTLAGNSSSTGATTGTPTVATLVADQILYDV